MLLIKNAFILISTIFIFLLLFSLNPAYPVEIKDRNEYLVDGKGDDGDIYINRFSIHEMPAPPGMETCLFGEIQWNFDISEFEKITAGGEIGKRLWKYLYAGQSIQFINGQILDYMTFSPNNYSIETTTSIELIVPVLKNIADEKLNLRFWEEYSYNLERGAAGLNEVGIETAYRLTKNTSCAMGWRHTDRIHNFDTDYMSSSFTLNF